MNKYLMAVYHYFNGYQQFTIEAKNKKEALNKGRTYVLQNPLYLGSNYDTNDVKCIKKLNNKKKSSII